MTIFKNQGWQNLHFWVVSALLAVGVVYGTLASTDAALAARIEEVNDRQTRENQEIQHQLDRIEQHVISIEEHLRNGNKYGPD